MTRFPEPGHSERPPGGPQLSPEDRRKVIRAAILRPINLLMLALGAFAIVLSWWFLPLTLVVYTLLVFLSARDPFFERQVLGERDSSISLQNTQEITPERRARWLPRGETRRKVEETLQIYRTAVASIEEADYLVRSVLDDAVPKLHAAAERLVEVAQNREKAATAISELQTSTLEERNQAEILRRLENQIHVADIEMTKTHDKLAALRARLTQISTANEPELNARSVQSDISLDELNAQLEAVAEITSDGGERSRPPRIDP